MRKCHWCGKKYRNQYTKNVIVTDTDIFGTCSDNCKTELEKDIKIEPEFYGMVV